jgi:adenylate kinase
MKILINDVDSYLGKFVSKWLSRAVPGETLKEAAEEENEEDEAALPDETDDSAKANTFVVIGTRRHNDNKKPDWVADVVDNDDPDRLNQALDDADMVIYNIVDDASQIEAALAVVKALSHEGGTKTVKNRTFILVSTVMTWARSKPLDPDDPEIPFTDDDYRRRKPHMNFKEHCAAEKLVIKLGKSNKNKLSTYVVAAGLVYGQGENAFHFLFKEAWHNAPVVPIFGEGANIIPTIHVSDLAQILHNVIDQKPKTRYIVAVDESQSNLEDIVKAISDSLATGKVAKMPKEEAALIKGVKQMELDMLLVNLRMECVFVKENMKIHWVSEAGIANNIVNTVKEYRGTRQLLPIRLCILGPPAVGKSTVAKHLCDYYKLHHVHLKEVIDSAIQKVEQSANRALDGRDQDDGEDDNAAEDADLLEAVKANIEENNGRLDDGFVVRFVRNKLLSPPCQNQGFVLEGYPKTLTQAKELFVSSEEDADSDDADKPNYETRIMPEMVVHLEAPDEFLKERVMALPEQVVHGTHNTEEGLLRRLAQYRSDNSEDETVLNYFDELEIHPEHFDATKDTTEDMKWTADEIIRILGDPRNYGPTPEEIEEQKRAAMEARLRQEREDEEECQRKEAEELLERRKNEEMWAARLEEVKRQEHEQLETRSVPLRNYLMKHVMPTLTQGLVDCCKVRPNDPVDYLAEYLFKHNPQVD